MDKDEGSDASLTIGSLTIHPQTSSTLSDVEIDEKLTISQEGSLNIKNVKLDKSNLELNLISYNNDNYQTPLIRGNLGSSPKSITLTNIKDESPVKDAEYLLFENGCDNWADAIDLKGSQFNEKICKTFKEQILQEFHGSLFVKKGKNKLSAGQIAGIAIGCVAFVAIIVVVVVVVIKKINKKNNENESSDIDMS